MCIVLKMSDKASSETREQAAKEAEGKCTPAFCAACEGAVLCGVAPAG